MLLSGVGDDGRTALLEGQQVTSFIVRLAVVPAAPDDTPAVEDTKGTEFGHDREGPDQDPGALLPSGLSVLCVLCG